METSANPFIFSAKNFRFSRSRSCPAFIPRPFLTAASRGVNVIPDSHVFVGFITVCVSLGV